MATQEVNKPQSLPPYPEMILRAIEALNGDTGSNKSTISKYIESTYGSLPAGHSSLLTHHLNMMKASGELVFWKNNYIKRDLSSPRRGRGRPPKEKGSLLPPVAGVGIGTVTGAGVVLSPKPRGRPPKDPNAPPKPPKPVKMKVSSGTGKPRGRPRKLPRPNDTIVPPVVAVPVATTGRPRGRPPKAKEAPLTEVSVQQ